MRKVVFFCATLTCASHRWRMPVSLHELRSNAFPKDLESLHKVDTALKSQSHRPASGERTQYPLREVARLLLTLNSAAAFSPSGHSRRSLLQTAAFGAGAAAFPGTLPALAADENLPVLVLGANGGTGRECVNYLLGIGKACIAATRTGEFDAPASSLLKVAKGDVTNSETMRALIQPGKLGGVIYAASASRKQEAKDVNNAKAIDQRGVVECAQLCIASQVPRMVLVSSGGVSKPMSPVYLFLNVAAGGIMDAKISGENEMRRLYAMPGVADKNIGYTIVRPGGLTTGSALGVGALELNQGDDKSGRIARADVAGICIQSLYSKAAFDTTFECYNADTAKGLDNVFASNAKGATDGAATAKTGRERRGDTWPQLFEGLERDRVG